MAASGPCPAARRLLVATGEITGGEGVDTVGCSLSISIRVKDAVELFHREADFGHHLAMVYGDYAGQLRELAGVMDFDLVEV